MTDLEKLREAERERDARFEEWKAMVPAWEEAFRKLTEADNRVREIRKELNQ